jgi:hypothetical protein
MLKKTYSLNCLDTYFNSDLLREFIKGDKIKLECKADCSKTSISVEGFKTYT